MKRKEVPAKAEVPGMEKVLCGKTSTPSDLHLHSNLHISFTLYQMLVLAPKDLKPCIKVICSLFYLSFK